ncbi:growth hormone secretagogue receptor type 1-like [Limanda limanda]|uniref:growth hormone secretagogue receptor type 1-like n=1 Tax=Limanda limanda TaxID=27771 RepID=UPI0029C7E48E|nr:growth hormone secretagogue receptor type 1-like [Limanda limanda]
MDPMEEGNVSCGVKNCATPGFKDYRFDIVIHKELPWSGFIWLVFSLLGNTLTLLVVWLRPHMRSSTDLYLGSMAVSDLLNLLLLLLDIHKVMIGLGVFACKLTVFLSECCYYCTILHITFLSLERYLVVCWPITSKTLMTHRRPRAVIGCLWLGAAVSAAPFLVMVEVDHKGKEHEKEYCGLSHSSFSSGLMLPILIIYNLYFLVPLCILGLVFILIGRTLRLRPKGSLKDKSQQRTVKMLGVIFLAFFLCWLPYIVCQTMFSGINPLVYHLMSARYRHAIFEQPDGGCWEETTAANLHRENYSYYYRSRLSRDNNNIMCWKQLANHNRVSQLANQSRLDYGCGLK